MPTNTSDFDKQIAQIKDEYKAKMEKLQEEEKKKRAAIESEARKEFSKAFSGALDCFKSLPADVRLGAWQDDGIAAMLKEFGLQAKDKKGSPSNGNRTKAEEYLEFLAVERSTADVMKKFGKSSPAVLNRLNAFKEKGKVQKIDKPGRMLFWKKA